MGFLDQFKRTRDSDIHEDWKVIESELQLQAAIDESFKKPVVLFKHSVSCGISAGVKYGLERDWDFTADDLSFYYLDLLSFRSVSNKIAQDLGVTHQSPQVILLKDGKAVYNTSHHAISIAALRNHI
jgi:monothiol bacilliredoxin